MDDFGKINTFMLLILTNKPLQRDSPSSLFTKNVNVEISMIAI
jgi:hypothetical protein